MAGVTMKCLSIGVGLVAAVLVARSVIVGDMVGLVLASGSMAAAVFSFKGITR